MDTVIACHCDGGRTDRNEFRQLSPPHLEVGGNVVFLFEKKKKSSSRHWPYMEWRRNEWAIRSKQRQVLVAIKKEDGDISSSRSLLLPLLSRKKKRAALINIKVCF